MTRNARSILVISLLIAGCAQGRPQYTPRLPCPDIEPLAPTDTLDMVVSKYEKLSEQYKQCRKARRVNPRKGNP